MPRRPLHLLRRAALPGALAAGLLAAAPAAPAVADSTFTITGGGWGHGIGMSQYGALGYAEHGWDYRAILAHYYSGAALGQTPIQRVVRVLLQSPKVASFTGATQAGTQRLAADQTYRVARKADGTLALRDASGRELAAFRAPLVVTGPGPIRLLGTASNGLRDGSYRGWLELRPGGSGVLAVNAIGLEQYVAGVVSAESPSTWPLAALEAQAIAARTYAITTGAAPSQGFEQYADTRSQMYLGVAAETPRTNQAVNGTRGQVVTYGGRPVTTFFFSTSGGRTENIEDSFLGATPRPWLRSVDDPFDTTSPHHRWTPIVLTLDQAASKLRGLVNGSLLGIQVVQRGVSPRIVWADVVGTGGTTRVSGPTLRARLGLMDTWAYFQTITSSPVPGGGIPAGDGGAAGARRALAGQILPAGRGTPVQVQRRVGPTWVAAGRTTVGAGGRYRASVGGPGVYRVLARGAVGPAVRVAR